MYDDDDDDRSIRKRPIETVGRARSKQEETIVS